MALHGPRSLLPSRLDPLVTPSVREQLAALTDKGRRRVTKLVDRARTRSARMLVSGRTHPGKPLRALRRSLMAEHCATTGKPNSGRQWVRLRKRLQREAIARVAQERAA